MILVPLQGPRVELVEDDHHEAPRSHAEPRVEEPDDEPGLHRTSGRTRQREYPVEEEPNAQRVRHYGRSHQQQYPGSALAAFGPGGGLFGGMLGGSLFAEMDQMMRQGMASGGGFSYSYSSTTVGGPGGQSYTRTETTRQGPGGIHERQETVRDSRTGRESVTIHRGLGDRGRTVVRSRDMQTGHEVCELSAAGGLALGSSDETAAPVRAGGGG